MATTMRESEASTMATESEAARSRRIVTDEHFRDSSRIRGKTRPRTTGEYRPKLRSTAMSGTSDSNKANPSSAPRGNCGRRLTCIICGLTPPAHPNLDNDLTPITTPTKILDMAFVPTLARRFAAKAPAAGDAILKREARRNPELYVRLSPL